MTIRGYGSRTRAFSALALFLLSMIAIPSARSRGQEPAAKVVPADADEATSLRGPSFLPDGSFHGSTLAGWHTLGQASWRADKDEIIGKGTGAGGSGWLILDRSFQDTGLYASFQCVGPCDTGVLLRLRHTPDGMQGTYLAVKEDGLRAYSLALDAEGKEIQRKELRNAGGQIRFAPPPPDPSAPVRPIRFPALPSAPPGLTIPITRPRQGIREGEWNEVELLLDADILRAFMNDGGGQASAATEEMNGYGSIALYVGKDSEIRFKNVAYKDLAIKRDPPEEVGRGFRMQRLSPFYYGWSAAAADFNHDGKMDIVSGPFIYFGPDFLTSREIYPAEAYNPSTQYSMNDWVEHAYDFTGDGWPDVLTTSHAGGGKEGAVLYVNPKGESRRWEKHQVVPMIQSEETVLKDVDGDGKPELVYEAEGYMRYAKPDPANPTGTWTIHTISEKGPWPAHGIGVGDVNGDGRADILEKDGWWEQPASLANDPVWQFHKASFGTGGAQMHVYDVNGDGLNDVITSIAAHGYGLAWYEQVREVRRVQFHQRGLHGLGVAEYEQVKPNGTITFKEHIIMNKEPSENRHGLHFAQMHAIDMIDMDGDGIKDIVTGKRFWAHGSHGDVEPSAPAVLYWFKIVRTGNGQVDFVPHLIDDNSGIGTQVMAGTISNPKYPDVVVGNKKGVFVHLHETRQVSRAEWEKAQPKRVKNDEK